MGGEKAAPAGDAARRTGGAEALAALEAEVAGCRACAAEFAATATAHEPRPVTRASATARVLVVGQAPGARAHASGLPFDDRSGERLRAWMGVDRRTFYDRARVAVLPMAFCFPGYDRRGADLAPPKRCAALWRARFLALMPQLELTLLVGAHAQAWALGRRRRATLTETVMAWRDYAPGVLPLPHPSWRNTAWLQRNPWFEAELAPWLAASVARLTG